MNKLYFEVTPSGYLVKSIDGSSSPSGNRAFKSIELAILWIESRCPGMYEYQCR